MLANRIKDAIRDVPDFPKEGIIFKDITPVLQNALLCKDILAELYGKYKDHKLDAVLGIESRGFLFGPQLALMLGIPFVPVRKKGKLPYQTISESYTLEYGEATLEMHTDALKSGDSILIHDDLLATGGTALATSSLAKKLGAEVIGFSFLVELSFLGGAKKLKQEVDSLVTY
jgi:adenine phosphoribosyltransferase